MNVLCYEAKVLSCLMKQSLIETLGMAVGETGKKEGKKEGQLLIKKKFNFRC